MIEREIILKIISENINLLIEEDNFLNYKGNRLNIKLSQYAFDFNINQIVFQKWWLDEQKTNQKIKNTQIIKINEKLMKLQLRLKKINKII